MGRRFWTDTDLARMWVAYEASGHSQKAASSETGIPYATCVTYIKKWNKQGGPPASVIGAIRPARDSFVARMESARDMALDRLIEIVPEIKNAQQAATVVGILDDKIARAKNVQVPELPPAPASLEQVQDQVGQWLLDAVAKAASRRVDTIESTAVEQADEPALEVVSSDVGEADAA